MTMKSLSMNVSTCFSALYGWIPIVSLLLIGSISNTDAQVTLDDTTIKLAVNDYLTDGSMYGSIAEWDTSQVTDMAGLFAWEPSFNGDLSQWDVSNVTNMYEIFYAASSFNSDISMWNVSKVTDMSWMFSHTDKFNGNLNQWDVSQVKDMYHIFYTSLSFNSDVSQWNVSNVTNMSGMFQANVIFNGDISQWDVSNVTDMSRMFADASSFDQMLCWDVSDKNTADMFTKSGGLISCPPTASPTLGLTDIQSFVDRPFYIMSGLSTVSDKWCMFPANNYIAQDTKIVISKCKEWKSYSWTIDHEGKIKNFKDPSFCIHMIGRRMLIKKCVDGLRNQRWRYSSKGTLMTKNGSKGAMVEDGVAYEKAVVKHLSSDASHTTLSETWNLDYSYAILPFPAPNTFRIVSDLTTGDKKWCIYPANNSVDNGTKMVLSDCKGWATFNWMMDNQGRIKNSKDPTKCITRLYKRMQLNDCIDDNKFQRWIYSTIDRKLSAVANGNVQATVVNNEAAFNTAVKALQNLVTAPLYQTWELEEVL